MKKLVAILMILIMSFTMLSAFAETVTEPESEFEKVLLKKGTLIVKEFIDCGVFEKDKYFDYGSSDEMFGFTKTLKFQTASILDVETGTKVYALRITTGYYNSKYAYGEAVGVMDADEIDGAIQTLKYIKQNIGKLKDYSEVEWKWVPIILRRGRVFM